MPPITTWKEDDDPSEVRAKMDALKEACAETDAIRKRKGKPRALPKDFNSFDTQAIYDRFNGKTKPKADE